MRIGNFINRMFNSFPRVLSTLEPGKTYVLQVDFDSVNLSALEALVKNLADGDIRIVVINKNMNFVSVPEGYEIVKKD